MNADLARGGAWAGIVTLLLLPVLALSAPEADGDGVPEPGPIGPLITRLIALIREHYILEERIPKIEDTLREHQRHGDYEGLRDVEALARRLTQDLRMASADLHFGVLPRLGGAVAKGAPRQDGGFPRVEVLKGNVGYLQIAAFVDPETASGAADDAFRTLAGTDALIIDVRSSRGGHPGMVAYLASYLFSGETFVLNRIYWRNRDETREFRTRSDLGGPRYAGKVYVLTSSSTPSAAEGFAYHLKHFDRAVIVGETTTGAAHPIQTFPLGEALLAYIPTGRAINPRTGTNWEGTGVEPDVARSAAEALETAYRLALEALLAEAENPEAADRLRKALSAPPVESCDRGDGPLHGVLYKTEDAARPHPDPDRGACVRRGRVEDHARARGGGDRDRPSVDEGDDLGLRQPAGVGGEAGAEGRRTTYRQLWALYSPFLRAPLQLRRQPAEDPRPSGGLGACLLSWICAFSYSLLP